MKKEHSLLLWLIANLVLLSGSMLMTWFTLGFEPPPALKPISGWELIFIQIVTSIELLLDYGFAWLWVLTLLRSVGSIFVMSYIAYKITSFLKNKSFEGKKVLSIALIFVIGIFLLRGMVNGLNDLPSLGYWLFVAGLLSSVVFEWQTSHP